MYQVGEMSAEMVVAPSPTDGVGEGVRVDKPVIELVRKLCSGDLSQVTGDDFAFANLVVGKIHEATGRFAVRAIVERGWPVPTQARCGLPKRLYGRGCTTLREAGLLGADRRWKVSQDRARAWLNEN